MSKGPAPTHLDARDPGKPARLPIVDEIEQELASYPARKDLVLLAPEDCWNDLARQLGADPASDELDYKGVRLRKAAVTAVIAQEGF